jgi:hypothetical protein
MNLMKEPSQTTVKVCLHDWFQSIIYKSAGLLKRKLDALIVHVNATLGF